MGDTFSLLLFELFCRQLTFLILLAWCLVSSSIILCQSSLVYVMESVIVFQFLFTWFEPQKGDSVWSDWLWVLLKLPTGWWVILVWTGCWIIGFFIYRFVMHAFVGVDLHVWFLVGFGLENVEQELFWFCYVEETFVRDCEVLSFMSFCWFCLGCKIWADFWGQDWATVKYLVIMLWLDWSGHKLGMAKCSVTSSWETGSPLSSFYSDIFTSFLTVRGSPFKQG